MDRFGRERQLNILSLLAIKYEYKFNLAGCQNRITRFLDTKGFPVTSICQHYHNPGWLRIVSYSGYSSNSIDGGRKQVNLFLVAYQLINTNKKKNMLYFANSMYVSVAYGSSRNISRGLQLHYLICKIPFQHCKLRLLLLRSQSSILNLELSFDEEEWFLTNYYERPWL